MRPESGKTVSYWMDGEEVPEFGPLQGDMTCDVCVVGAGIAGLTTAYLLAKAGKQVVVVDDGPVCGGETQRTTAHLTNVIDDRYVTIKREHGIEKARLAYRSHTAAIQMIENIASEERIDCDFVRLDGYLFRGEKHSDERLLWKELDVCTQVGFHDIEMLDSVPLKFFPEERLCIRFPMQGQFHVLKYLNGVMRAIARMGGQIYGSSHVEDVVDGVTAQVKVAGGKVVHAASVVIATNSPITDRVKVHTKQAQYRTYVVAGKVDKGAVPPGLYWDTDEPYHYIRCHPIDGDEVHEMLIVGGEDHRTGEEKDTDACFAALEDWARKMFPVLAKIDYRWSGQVVETVDGLAFIGRDPAHGKNVFIATGDSGMGMTHGTIAGMLLYDMILGIDNIWAEVYSPSRIPLKAAKEYVAENVNTAMQYARYAQPAEVDSLDKLGFGEGALMRHDGRLYAVYSDEYTGEITQCSATCPHLGGIVQWNATEKSWDCPSHGSRFKATGEVINGPANYGLKKIAGHDLIRRDLEEETGLPRTPPGDSGIQPPPPPIM